MTDLNTHAGFVAVVGAPNAGKSTLVNALVGQKVAIVSAKAQTTRARLMGIAIQVHAPATAATPGPRPEVPDDKREQSAALNHQRLWLSGS